MTVRGDPRTTGTEPYIVRFNRTMAERQARHASEGRVDDGRRSRPALEGLPFASLSLFAILGLLFMLSMHLGGWTWSSWTYAFSLCMVAPLAVIEVKRKAVITGAAIFLVSVTAVIAAGLPQYFGYSVSDLSWYDLTAHYLGALTLTVVLWSMLYWTRVVNGPAAASRACFYVAVIGMLVASVTFELLEFFTDAAFGWTNFHSGVDTVGDILFDVAGVMSAATLIARHRIVAMRLPFWHADASAA